MVLGQQNQCMKFSFSPYSSNVMEKRYVVPSASLIVIKETASFKHSNSLSGFLKIIPFNWPLRALYNKQVVAWGNFLSPLVLVSA